MFINLYNTIQSGSFSGYSRLHHWQFCLVTFSLPLATTGPGNFVILVLDVTNLPRVKHIPLRLLRASRGTSFNPLYFVRV